MVGYIGGIGIDYLVYQIGIFLQLFLVMGIVYGSVNYCI